METRNGRPLRANRGKNPNARWIVDEPAASKPKRRRSSPKPKKPKHEEITEGETRCRCEGKVGDDKTMAECENCRTWQHVICEFGVDDESALPEPYHCFRCRDSDSDEASAKVSAKAEGEATTESSSPSNDREIHGNGKVYGNGAHSNGAHSNGAHGNGAHGNGAESKADSNGIEEGIEGIAALKDKTRKGVAEAWLRILETLDAQDASSRESLALALEAALFRAFARANRVSPAYREQFRTLSFNLKDSKNAPLQRAVVSGSLPADKFVRMSSRELQNPELKQMTQELHEESIRESIIKEEEPPREIVDTSTAELNVEPSHIALEQEEQQDELDQAEAMKEPLGPPPQDTGAHKEPPAWTGTVKLEDNTIAFAGEGFGVGAPHEWATLGPELVVRGLVQVDSAFEYLQESATEEEHELGALALTGDRAKLGQLFGYMHGRDRVGSIRTSEPNIKDAYLLPWDGADLPYLNLGEEAKELLNHLKTSHEGGKLLVAVFVYHKLG